MKTFTQIQRELRRYHKKNYYLLFGCGFFSVLLITAYATMMRSPNVLTVLPEGGDSRKQVMMVFVMAMIGCCAFVAYTAALFFKYKSREVGIMMALGASKKTLKKQLYKELAGIGIASCTMGTILGGPLAYAIWQFFCTIVVDSEEMQFQFSFQAYGFSAAFLVFVLGVLLWMGRQFVNQSNIRDIMNSQRKCEAVRDVNPWYGWIGIVLMIIGGLLGYFMPSVFVRVLHWYPPEGLTFLFYIPLFVGLYIVLLYTVVHGWKREKNRYRDLIPRSMMKFQGRQTVLNMLVITVLIGGAYFASLYTPMLMTGAAMSLENRSIDYQFHYRQDETKMVNEDEIKALAQQFHVEITDYSQEEFSNLSKDGYREIEDKGGTYHNEYKKECEEASYLPEYVYERIAGEDVKVEDGTYRPILNEDGSGAYRIATDGTLLTNPVTGRVMDAQCGDYLYDDMLALYYVISDSDYARITQRLTDDWKEYIVDFNVKNVEDTYPFAKALYNEIIQRMSTCSEVTDFYDRIIKKEMEAEGKDYDQDMKQYGITYDMKDTSDFRLYWKYITKFRIMEQQEMLKTMAVYFMLFIFIALICFAAVLVIAYTRCITVALYNRQMYDDLKHLGAGHGYLYSCVRSQIVKVFQTPTIVGTLAILILYIVIMYGNSGRFETSELAGIRNCLILIAFMTGGIWGFYRWVLKKVCRMLDI